MIGYIRPKGVLVISKMDINGKVALVTGGAGGIGRAMVDILLQTNAKCVYLLDDNASSAEKTLQELRVKYGDERVRFLKCDVTSYQDMEECFKMVKSTFGELHIVCNNAGIFNEMQWQRMLEINLNGIVNGTKLAVQYMDGASGGGGVIVNTASIVGLQLMPFAPMYATSKCAVIGFSRQTANFDPEVIKKKIRVNVLCPPAVNTPMQQSARVEARYQSAFKKMLDKQTVIIEPHELAVHFLKLIQEPQHGRVLFVEDVDKYEYVEDETRLFREKHDAEQSYNDLVNAVVEQGP